MVDVLNEVQEQANMLEWHRDDAIAELLRLKQPDPQIRHRESITSYVDVRLLPREGVVWSGGIMPEQLVVEKRCFGGRYELIQHEKAVLESLRTDRIGDAVFGMVGQFEYSDSTHDDPLIGVRLQYGGLDLSKWNQICYSNESRLDPFCQAPFLLQLARRVLGCLFVFHSNGYIHCDLKLDNICARTRRVSRQGDYLIGAIDLQTLKLIDFGLSICRRRLDNGMLSVTHAPPKWAARRYSISNGADTESWPFSKAGTWANYLSDGYVAAFGQPDRASRIDGRVDLYSLASWLRQLCYAYDLESAGMGPWPSARVRKELIGTVKERELLQALPNMVHESYRLFNLDDLPHVDIMSKIDKVVGHMPWEWAFEAPIGVTGQQLIQRRERAASTLMTTLHHGALVDFPVPVQLRSLVENERSDRHRPESQHKPDESLAEIDPVPALEPGPSAQKRFVPETIVRPMRLAEASASSTRRQEVHPDQKSDDIAKCQLQPAPEQIAPSQEHADEVEPQPAIVQVDELSVMPTDAATGSERDAGVNWAFYVAQRDQPGDKAADQQSQSTPEPVDTTSEYTDGIGLQPVVVEVEELPVTQADAATYSEWDAGMDGVYFDSRLALDEAAPTGKLIDQTAPQSGMPQNPMPVRRQSWAIFWWTMTIPLLAIAFALYQRAVTPVEDGSDVAAEAATAAMESDIAMPAEAPSTSSEGGMQSQDKDVHEQPESDPALPAETTAERHAVDIVPEDMLRLGVLSCYGGKRNDGPSPGVMDEDRAKSCGASIAQALHVARTQSEQGHELGGGWKIALTDGNGALLPLLWRELDQSTRTSSSSAAPRTLANQLAPALDAWQGQSAALDWATAVMYACYVDRHQHPDWRQHATRQLQSMSKRYADIQFGQKAAAAVRNPTTLCSK